jgi:ribose/xylose/arabinose/galactoside ABC-type transport system permease subunit
MQLKSETIDIKSIFSNRIFFLIGLNLLILIIMTFLSPYFLSLESLLGMTQFGAVIALISLGESLVILGGEGGIDLSVGSVLSLSGVILGILVSAGLNIWIACFLTLIFGFIIGSINGFLISYIEMPAFVVTVGALYAYGALAMVLTGGIPISDFPDSFSFVGQGYILQTPVQILFIVLPLYIILNWVMKNTDFGRKVYHIGVNNKAAGLSGINTKKIRLLLYAISGTLAALGAIVMSSWLMAARPDAGYGYELQAITVSVLGGISIMGGEGSLTGTMLSALIITMIAYGLQLANINTIWQLAVLGLLLLFAVLANRFFDIQ